MCRAIFCVVALSTYMATGHFGIEDVSTYCERYAQKLPLDAKPRGDSRYFRSRSCECSYWCARLGEVINRDITCDVELGTRWSGKCSRTQSRLLMFSLEKNDAGHGAIRGCPKSVGR